MTWPLPCRKWPSSTARPRCRRLSPRRSPTGSAGVSGQSEGVGGVVLDTSVLISFAEGDPVAMVAVDKADRDAQALLVPAVALTTAYAQAGPRGHGPYLDHLLDLGVVVGDGAL